MKKNTLSSKILASVGALTLSLSASMVFADTLENVYDTNLAGSKSVPPVHTPAIGTFTTKIAEDMGQIHYSLHYDDVVGVPVAAHIHFAQPFANGAPLVTICDTETATNETPNIPDCPANGEFLDGIITADDVRAIPAQGVHEGDFDALVLFIEVGFTYFNLHTAQHHDSPTPLPPVSELRGQLEINDHPFPIKY